jgi:hypothetical protein
MTWKNSMLALAVAELVAVAARGASDGDAARCHHRSSSDE